MTTGQIRSLLYGTARALGWYQAARRGTLRRRTGRVVLGRAANRAIRSILK